MMKKLWALFFVCCTSFNYSNAQSNQQDKTFTEVDSLSKTQDPFYQKGKSHIGLGYGFIIDEGIIFLYRDPEHTIQREITGPFYLKYDFGLTEKFSLGVNVAYLKQHFRIDYRQWNGYDYYDDQF